MKTIIAKTTAGQEYLYSTKNSFSVSKASAQKICDICNECGWNIKGNEKWHVYDVDEWEFYNTFAPCQKLWIRKGLVKAAWY